jgi:hypothetical protein
MLINFPRRRIFTQWQDIAALALAAHGSAELCPSPWCLYSSGKLAQNILRLFPDVDRGSIAARPKDHAENQHRKALLLIHLLNAGHVDPRRLTIGVRQCYPIAIFHFSLLFAGFRRREFGFSESIAPAIWKRDSLQLRDMRETNPKSNIVIRLR